MAAVANIVLLLVQTIVPVILVLLYWVGCQLWY